MSSNNKQSRNKRKRPRDENEQRSDEEKLTRSAAVFIRREGKQVRTYATQKLIKRIKSLTEKQQQQQQKAQTSTDESATTKSSTDKKIISGTDALDKAMQKRERQIKNLESRLSATKEFNLDALVKVSIERLGLDLNDARDPSLFSYTVSDEEKTIVESMLEHQKMMNAMRDLRGKISRVKMQKKEAQAGTINTENERERGRSNRDKVHEYSAESGIFIESLSGAVGTMNQEEDYQNQPYDDPFGEYAYSGTKKKNRKGQRARKAAALAKEARAAGKTWDSSVNWRPKKARFENAAEDEHHSGLSTKNDVKAAEVADMGKNWKDDGKAHPSWAAKQHAKQQSGIASFAGKKITFD